MTNDTRQQLDSASPLRKCPSGIFGLDAITGGGLPLGRPTLVCGAAGCGKTLLGIEFLVRGITQFDEPGVFMTFEETEADLATNVASLGFDLRRLIADRKLVVDHAFIEPSEIHETGDYDLEGLFIRLGYAIDSVGARRVVLDTLETLFAGLPNAAIVRAELRRLFRWLKERGVTAIITGERAESTLTRYGIEEYVSDCVIVLDHRVTDQMSTRRLRIAKYRGSTHGTNEYPFLIDTAGISVLPVTSLGLDHAAIDERISSGIEALDGMLGGRGYYRGSTVLVSGAAGSGKTSVAAAFADAACRRGERCLSFLFEESPSQLLRNMRSIGIDLQPWAERNLLRFVAARPTVYGLEAHLVTTTRLVEEFQPRVVVIDPISSFSGEGSALQVSAMLVRLVDFLKQRGITVLMVNLARAGSPLEQTDAGISSLVDTWLLLREGELTGSRHCGICVLKSRGMAHSHDVRAFHLTDRGIVLGEPRNAAARPAAGETRKATV